MKHVHDSLPPYLKVENGELWLTEDDRENLKISYRIKDIIFSEQSDFQHVMILDSYDFGRMLVLDGVVQTTSIDGHIYNEMISHVPLQFRPLAKKVLIIGGGDCGAAREVAKYKHIEEIHMVEIDEKVVLSCKAHLQEVSGNLSDPRVQFIYDDGVAFVKKCENEYDVIIIDSSDPVGPAEALFSRDFYANVRRALKEDGLMVCQSQSPIFHLDILRQTYTNIRELFPHVQVYTATVPTYPGGLWSFTIGSTKPLSLPETLTIPPDTKYVNEGVVKQCFQLPQFLKKALEQ
ncbi:polyamine aminopropyltransferase [Parageobacillus thermoglucosidasius]|uniref:polyamine aminopropyltransferase n=1 Tax=Parageobacillus thermoglucosidasius TaxID=1426 RepID=UPI0027FD7F5B|nr:polyamine aminopropyltransferase [Parageobacillus thermoglucosidasius]